MDDSGPTASIIFVILLLIDVFFYGFGAAISNLNIKEVEKKSEEEKDKKSIRLQEIMQSPAAYVNTVQLVVTLINVIMGAFYLGMWLRSVTKTLEYVALNELEKFPAEAITAVAMVLTMFMLLYILLTFGVLLPKRIGARIPEKWAYACINPAYFVTKALLPFTGLISATTNGIQCDFDPEPFLNTIFERKEEIINMVQEGHEQGVIQASEAEMISNIFEYGDKEAQDIMTHRKSIVAIDGTMGLQDAITFMLGEKNSRYPVYDENIDHIIGILHLKDAMRFHIEDNMHNRPICELEGLLRNAVFVPKTKNIDELFQEMQSQKLQMVIVVDEYGQTEGLVAMEDILEEIVGNIMDEYDEDQEYIEDKGNDEYIMEGKTPLEDLEELFGISFEDAEFETLNGFMISKLDRIPEPDEKFDVDYQGYNFKILSVENKMIQSVLVTKLSEETVEQKAEEQSVLDENQK